MIRTAEINARDGTERTVSVEVEWVWERPQTFEGGHTIAGHYFARGASIKAVCGGMPYRLSDRECQDALEATKPT